MKAPSLFDHVLEHEHVASYLEGQQRESARRWGERAAPSGEKTRDMQVKCAGRVEAKDRQTLLRNSRPSAVEQNLNERSQTARAKRASLPPLDSLEETRIGVRR
jgi:hypothetical protein